MAATSRKAAMGAVALFVMMALQWGPAAAADADMCKGVTLPYSECADCWTDTETGPLKPLYPPSAFSTRM